MPHPLRVRFAWKLTAGIFRGVDREANLSVKYYW